MCTHACVDVYLCLFAWESCRWVMRADGCPWIRHGGAGKDPAVGRALTHLGGLRGRAFDQEHQPDGIRDGAMIWKGSAPLLLWGCLCLHVSLCQVLVIGLDVVLWTKELTKGQVLTFFSSNPTKARCSYRELSWFCGTLSLVFLQLQTRTVSKKIIWTNMPHATWTPIWFLKFCLNPTLSIGFCLDGLGSGDHTLLHTFVCHLKQN